MPSAAARWLLGLLALCLAANACGQKGPPLAPLHLVPAAVAEVSLRRVADRAHLRFVLPSRNANGPGRVDLDRVEIYAVTIAPGAPAPPNRELLSKGYLVGAIPVRPAPADDETPVEDDGRPEPGETVTFDEELTPAKLTAAAAKPASRVAIPPPASFALPGTPISITTGAPLSTDPVRVYVVRGVTKGGREGPPSPRVQFPVVPLPPPPPAVTGRFTETAIVVEWKPPPALLKPLFNVYRSDDAVQPINTAPVAATTFELQTELTGEPQCFRVRSVTMAATVPIEGVLSEEACVTPRDIFPPAAPKGLAAVPTAGQISLIWDANAEKDLAGYLVLRGEAGGSELQAITPAPIRETSYRDTTTMPGVRYVYAVVAVDSATPANVSPQSTHVEETAR